MRVDFYQVGSDPAETVVALIARNTLKAGKRLLVVASEPDRLDRISNALWGRSDTFLANGRAGAGHEARQPVLLSETLEATNGASFLALADGTWRAPDGFDRVFLVFDNSTIDHARGVWRELGGQDGTERHFWKQEGGRWIEAA
ncbi:MAG: DNA polymerase III subunit chi [Novosphingobium sp.]